MRRLLVVLLVLPGVGCSSSADPGAESCTVSCPEGTVCDGNRCVPFCSPPCGPSQYCGTDRVCHDGPAPDGNVVPPVDGAPPAGDGPATDAGPKPDTVDPNKAVCDCLAQQPKPAYCLKQPTTCQAAADCCQTSSVPCGVYGNKYACNGGACERLGCGSDAECVTYAQAIQQPDAQQWVCHPGFCPQDLSYCSYPVKSCTQAADCCRPGQAACGVYSNHWACDGGKCKYIGCVSDGECVSYAQALSLPDAATYVCRTSQCYDTGFCVPQSQTCSQPTDCCNPQSSVPCGLYSNRFRCVNGACLMDYCTGKQDCVDYATAVGLPDASEYSCVAY